jgi:hypothetical protein
MSMFDAFVVCDLVHNTSEGREGSKVLRVTGTQCEANMMPYLGSNRLTPCLCASFLDLHQSFGFSQILGSYFTTSGAYAKILPVHTCVLNPSVYFVFSN